jgi:muramidase (phage lysozyme)
MDMNEGDINLKAFLKLIRWAEFYPKGIHDDDYKRLYGGGTFSDTSDHPRKKLTKWGKTSTAAGAYMIVEDTWDRYKKRLNLPDFSAASQDKAAIEIIRLQHALHLIQTGRIQTAIEKLRSQWSSLPGASQSRISLKVALKQFDTYRKPDTFRKADAFRSPLQDLYTDWCAAGGSFEL